jgi:hypothetical protein
MRFCLSPEPDCLLNSKIDILVVLKSVLLLVQRQLRDRVTKTIPGSAMNGLEAESISTCVCHDVDYIYIYI